MVGMVAVSRIQEYSWTIQCYQFYKVKQIPEFPPCVMVSEIFGNFWGFSNSAFFWFINVGCWVTETTGTVGNWGWEAVFSVDWSKNSWSLKSSWPLPSGPSGVLSSSVLVSIFGLFGSCFSWDDASSDWENRSCKLSWFGLIGFLVSALTLLVLMIWNAGLIFGGGPSVGNFEIYHKIRYQ